MLSGGGALAARKARPPTLPPPLQPQYPPTHPQIPFKNLGGKVVDQAGGVAGYNENLLSVSPRPRAFFTRPKCNASGSGRRKKLAPQPLQQKIIKAELVVFVVRSGCCLLPGWLLGFGLLLPPFCLSALWAAGAVFFLVFSSFGRGVAVWVWVSLWSGRGVVSVWLVRFGWFVCSCRPCAVWGGRVCLGSLVLGRFPFSCFSVLCAVASSPLFFVWRFFSCLFLAVGLAFGAVLRYTGVVPSLGGLSRVSLWFSFSVRCSGFLFCVRSRLLLGGCVCFLAPFFPLFLRLGCRGLFLCFVPCSAFCAGLLPCFLASVLCRAVLSGGVLGFCSRCASGWWFGWVSLSFSGFLWRACSCSFCSSPSRSRVGCSVLCSLCGFFGVAFFRAVCSFLGSVCRPHLACPVCSCGVRPWGRFRRPFFLWVAVFGLLCCLFWSRSRFFRGSLCCSGSCCCRRVGLPFRFPVWRLSVWCCSLVSVLRWRFRVLGFCGSCRGLGGSRLPLASFWGCRPVLVVPFGWGVVLLFSFFLSSVVSVLVLLSSPLLGGVASFLNKIPSLHAGKEGSQTKLFSSYNHEQE